MSPRHEISMQIFAADVICDTDCAAPPGHVSGEIHAPVGVVNADANFGLLPGRRDRSLRRIGPAQHSTGIKAAADIAKNWRSTALQGIDRCAANSPAGLIKA